jgi:ketosteroid isomerase-like protein
MIDLNGGACDHGEDHPNRTFDNGTSREGIMDSGTVLVERQGVIDAIVEWCRSVDSRDSAAMAELVTDPIHIDYRSSGPPADMPRSAWIARIEVLHGFDATLHMVSNFRVSVTGDEATCFSYVDAKHFLTEDGVENDAYVCGHYTHGLVRDGHRWRIRSAKFEVAGKYSGNDQFTRSFDRARALAPSRMPA